MDKAIFFKIGGLGDVLMTTPALRAYRKSFPQSHMIYIIGESNKKILQNNPYINEVIVVNDYSIYSRSVFRKLWETLRLVKIVLSLKPDYIFNFHRDWRFNFIFWITGTGRLYGFRRDMRGAFLDVGINYFPEQHEIDKYIQLLSVLPGFIADGHKMDIYPNDDDRESYKRLFCRCQNGKSMIGVIPGGALNAGMKMDSRRWPIDLFASLVNMVIADGKKVVLIGGPTDKVYSDYILKHIPPEKLTMIVDTVGKLSIQGSYLVLQNCNVAVSSDCGPMHVAAAAAIPIISIFGPTDPVEKKPLSNPGSFVFYADKQLPCIPCYHEGKFPECPRQQCMRLITPEMVFTKIQEIVAKQ